MVEERPEVIGENLKVFLHFDLSTNGVIELDESRKNKKQANKITGKLVEKFLHVVFSVHSRLTTDDSYVVKWIF